MGSEDKDEVQRWKDEADYFARQLQACAFELAEWQGRAVIAEAELKRLKENLKVENCGLVFDHPHQYPHPGQIDVFPSA